ncbi:hypothetical protein O5O45_28830 [Hahella aquimaris]|uniref:hypothetical protein n=1 Tax=Hahella sp. HNIBRBA332 TaxID=3015983 RepID=UPI00273A9011|nr:hypothetical protein [Hahella sp. HNIBRBA332]WLQ13739.1 hypothetical protein O5O45_28830 [Hahella sp. HNIBRBA332]
MSFEQGILKALEEQFKDGEIEVLTRRNEDGTIDSGIKLIHKQSGIEMVNDTQTSQIKNKAFALVKLLGQLKQS